jgi:hypothetical protein
MEGKPADPSLNCMVLAEKINIRKFVLSTRKRTPPVKLSKDLL